MTPRLAAVLGIADDEAEEAKARFEQGELLISQGYDMMLAGMHVITEIEEVIERLEEACK